MNAVARTSWIGLLLRQLPGPVLRQLDTWSHKVAQRRARQRHERWVRRRAAAQRTGS